MERKAFTNLMEASTRVLLGETHMVGKTVIVKGKKGKVVKQVSSDGKTESDEIYQVKFEDGTIEDIPARDMEMQGDISNRKEPSENELEDIVNEAKYRPTPVSPGSRYPTKAKKTKNTNAHSGIPGMSHEGKGILSSMTNSFGTGGGPWIDHDNIHNLTHHSVNQTLKKAHQHLKNNPHPKALEQLALVKKELGESVELGELKMPPKSGGTPMQRYAKNTLDRRNYIKGEGGWIAPTMTPQQRLTQLKKAKTSHYENKPKVE